MSDLTWLEPPPREREDAGDTEKRIARALRERPGEWALLTKSGSSSTVSNINGGRTPAWQPRGSFQATGRGRPDGRLDIYVRYVGGES